jgi:uncharacterized protein
MPRLDIPRVRVARALLALALLALAASPAAAQGSYVDPQGRFEAPVPPGWTDASSAAHATFTLGDPAAEIHVVAAPGSELDVVTAALGILVDPSLGTEFAASPLQTSPVGLPSGVWTQRVYAHGDDLVVAISTEADGVAYVVVTRATQQAFMSTVNAAVNHVLLGLTIPADESGTSEEAPYGVAEVEFAAGPHRLAGTLTLPETAGPHPAVVLISGSGAQDRDGRNPSLPGYAPNRWLADHLTRHGVAVLRFDERGVGASGGDHESATTAGLADDVEAAVAFARAHESIDPERVGLLGHSEGGVIAAMVAARTPEVAFVIAMAGSAVPYEELVVTQIARITEAMGGDDAAVEAAVAQQREALALAATGDWDALEAYLVDLTLEGIDALPPAQREAIADPEALARAQAQAQIGGLRHPWMQFFLAHDPADDWRGVRVPVLALFGGLDVQVDVDQNVPALRAALDEAGNRDVTIRVFDRANHLFQEAERGGPDEYPALLMSFVPGFLEEVVTWFEARFVDR